MDTDSREIDNVKTEKDNAMRKYDRQRKFKWIFEACAALLVLMQSSTWLPVAVDFIGDMLREIISVFRSHVFIFFLLNAILLAVYVLSGRITWTNDAGSGANLYDEFVTNSELSRRTPAEEESSPPPPAPERTIRVVEEEKCHSENVASTTTSVCGVGNRNDSKPNGSVLRRTEEEKVLVVVKKKSYKRTQSARLEGKKLIDQSQREFRRSCTDICRKLTSSGENEAEESSEVSRLSNEEFNQTIEAFIATQKWIQRQEYKEERKTEHYMTLAICQ
ncbi:uncharacterized protein LOC133804480 [Humulus lupulus]|uniref:uncharacterized protein LOC133804480 n=1 Tax=Humulus lupulus TaxID=3486 RepID=UPI002B40AEC0|nr:uncharacterized protein LOC133804480 [Humulus lupulus]